MSPLPDLSPMADLTKRMVRHTVVAVEGVDAAGKKTQTERLAAFLRGTRVEFPTYDTLDSAPTGRIIATHLKGRWAAQPSIDCAMPSDEAVRLDAHVFQCLQTVNRLEATPYLLTLREVRPVVLDRYWASAYAFGGADGLDKDWLLRISCALPVQPEVNVLLDVDWETSLARRPDRRDRYERMGRSFYENVRGNYLALFDLMAKRGAGVWTVVDARRSVEEVERDVRAAVSSAP